MKKIYILITVLLLSLQVRAQNEAQKIVSQMTLQEKAEMVIGSLWNMVHS